ncbi:hypothetical protein [Kamptonema sp. UHCC 0994]|uniref:hypothetical protein n=1 Tax=Kamptonema sp. UHCC 0994 TaxID=3031329 RepID=UPI0023B88E81|nr:hypothetical protein [Kamptonema sp. UHCC 0994]MDF0551820.1 hypothetical protein [Kamptonema sp. UHCC 0994]
MTTNNGTKFTPETKKTGDPVRSADWNAAMQEIVRLETAKMNREEAGSLQSSLTISEALTVSAIAPPASTPLEIKGALKLSAGVAIDRFSSNADLSDNSDSIVSTQKAVKTYVDNAVTNVNATVKTYVDTTREGSETQNFQAKDLRIYGNLVVEGSTISKSTEKMEGNVELGNDDGDIITVFGRVRSGHSSGFLQVHTPLQITENLMVDGNIGIGTTTPTDKLSIQGGAISFYNPDTPVPYVGLDYDKQSDGLRIRGNQGSTSLNTEYIIIKRVSGNVGIGTTDPNELLHIYRSRENAAVILQRQDGGTLKLKAQDTNVRITFDKPLYFDSDEVGTTRLAVTTDGKIGIGTITPGATLEVNGTIRAKNIESTNPFRHRMYPNDPIVYQDLFVARGAGAIAKLGNPSYYDDTTYTSKNLWNDRPMIAYGANNETDGNGAVVTIPDGYNTVWVRVLGERWNAIAAYLLDKDNKKTQDLGIWTGGFRGTNCYCPEGSLSDSYENLHQWLPIPIVANLGQPGGTRKLALISKPNTNSYFWLSGLAFSKNPWSHATQSAVGYYWKINGGDAISWHSENWNNDVLAYIAPKTNLELKVPVVPSGRDKLLYLVEHNNNWNGCMHSGITVNGKSIERLIATYDNPFARHWNSKFYQRYIAACIPADLIPDTKGMISYLSVKIDMSKQKSNIHFREMGTHDLEVPDNY